MSPETPRYDGLDALRAISMLLGLAYHAAYAYVPDVGPWYVVQDVSTSPAFVTLVGVLHSFRMQAFFVASGFLARLLLERKGGRVFLKDRVRRLALPFLAAAPVMVALDVGLRRWAASTGALDPRYPGGAAVLWRPSHLWFLEALLLFSLVGLASRVLKLPLGDLSPGMRRLLQVPEFFVLLGAVCGFGLVHLGEPMAGSSYVLDLSTLTHFGLFFAFGWWLHVGVEALPRLERCAWLVVPGLGLALFVFSRELQWQPLGRWLWGIISWCMVLGAMGLAVRLPHANRPRLRALVDASYWVYLVHYPLIVAGHVALARVDWPALPKYLLVVAFAAGASWGSYVVMVRDTRLGPWLGVRTRAIKTQ